MSISSINSNNYNMSYPVNKSLSNKNNSNYEQNTVTVTTQNTMTLHLNKDCDEGEKTIGVAVDKSGKSITVYKPKDFDENNPVYHVKTWDCNGNETDKMVNISDIDIENCDYTERWVYASHLSSTGKCEDAQRMFMRSEALDKTDNSNSITKSWKQIIKNAMDMQYTAGNLQGYLDFKSFFSFLDNKVK